MVRRRSMIATFLRIFAAQIAPFCPAGPLPITTRSYSLACISHSPQHETTIFYLNAEVIFGIGPRIKTMLIIDDLWHGTLVRELTSGRTRLLSAHADLASSPTSSAAWVPGHPDRQSSRRRRSVHQSRRDSKARRPPGRLLLAREDQTCGKSSASRRRDRTIRSRDRAPGKAHHSQIPRSALPPPDLHRARPFSHCRETPPTNVESNLAPARGSAGLGAGPSFPDRPARAAGARHPVD